MADIKTRDAVKGTIKTLDKAAVASERMKSAYAKTKEKAEEGYFSEESSPSEYAGNRLSSSAERVTKEGIHQFDKQGRKGVRETKENIIKAKDKIADFRQRRAEKAVSGKQAGAQVRYGTPSPSPAAQTGKAAQQANSTVKGTARKANKTVKTAAKGTVKTTQKTVKTAQATSKAAIKTSAQAAKASQAAARASVKTAQRAAHPAVKGIKGAQPSGAALVSFNEPAFCSNGKKQNYNAPTSQYAAFAYTAALNHLIADREHVSYIGDTAVLSWAEGAEPAYQGMLCGVLLGLLQPYSAEELQKKVIRMAAGYPVEFQEKRLDPNRTFCILGIAPNAGRLSVRFFLKNSFGAFMKNMAAHQERLSIIRPATNRFRRSRSGNCSVKR